jgi:hypothetical protein
LPRVSVNHPPEPFGELGLNATVAALIALTFGSIYCSFYPNNATLLATQRLRTLLVRVLYGYQQRRAAMTTFRELAIGDTFDFIGPVPHGGECRCKYHSFFDRCAKVSSRSYKSLDSGMKMTVGTINVEVYNVSNPSD